MNLYSIKKIWKPELFQGHNKNNKYFEGWYFKIVDSREDNVYAFIPGVSYDRIENSSHCFIQVIDGKGLNTHYFKYPLEKFRYLNDEFKIAIDKSYFSMDKMVISLKDDNVNIKGSINFNEISPWPVKLLSPGAMGWYGFIPFMECNHGVLSLNHYLKGKIKINQNVIDFHKGKGYIEKDWGTSFPKAWIWIQCNNFDDSDVSLMVSIGKIPWLGKTFTGFIIGLMYKNKLYRFTTYTNAKLKQLYTIDNRVLVIAKDRNYELIIEGFKKDGGVLYSPSSGIMKNKINESLDSIVKIKFYKNNKGNRELIYAGEGRNAGMEVTNIKELF